MSRQHKKQSMTLREAQAQAREYDARITSKADEYRVVLVEDAHDEDKAYYTDDIDDALKTARAMRDFVTKHNELQRDVTAHNEKTKNTKRAINKRVQLVMTVVDRYARLTTTAALMHNDDKVNEAREARDVCVRELTKLIEQAANSAAETKLNVHDERLASKFNKR